MEGHKNIKYHIYRNHGRVSNILKFNIWIQNLKTHIPNWKEDIYRLSHQAAQLLTYSGQGDKVYCISKIKQFLVGILKIKYGYHAAFSYSKYTLYIPRPLKKCLYNSGCYFRVSWTGGRGRDAKSQYNLKGRGKIVIICQVGCS